MIKKLMLVLTALMAFQSREGAALASVNGFSANHTFPQFVDGRFPDGTFYTSTPCRTQAKHMRQAAQSPDAFTMDIDAGQGDILTTPGLAEFRSGYVTVGCDQPIVLYTLHAPSKATLSEAVVLSSAQGTLSQLVVDRRNGARLGVALNNDSDV